MSCESLAREALSDLVSRYASLRSYRDHGQVTQRRAGEEPRFRVRFSTLYRQPLFRFQFQRWHRHAPHDPQSQHAVEFDGEHAYQIGGLAGDIMRLDSFEAAVARATGISHGSSHTIARLLVRGMGGLSYLELRNVVLQETARLDGVECYVLGAEHPQGVARYELWIEKERRLLRKRIANHGNWMSEEARDGIVIDEPIEDEVFVWRGGRVPANASGQAEAAQASGSSSPSKGSTASESMWDRRHRHRRSLAAPPWP
jgi:hypothetical protein